MAAAKKLIKSTLTAVSRWRIPRIEPFIVRTFPHDLLSFTQGLVFVNGDLYESSGGHAHSSVRCVDIRDGTLKTEISIENDFVEGIAFWQGLLYALSWKSGKARIFRIPELQQVGELSYPGEGWGLCSCNSGLVMSDGSGTLRFVDGDLRILRRMRVTVNRLPTRRLNDLESVGEFLYANVLLSSDILEISACDGCVTRIIDCSMLTAQAGPNDVEHTLNGIAYCRERGTFFVTGKCWNVMFEVDFRRNGVSAQ